MTRISLELIPRTRSGLRAELAEVQQRFPTTPRSPHFRPCPYSALTINVSICADTSELPGCLSVDCINKALRLEKMSVSH